MRAHDTRVLFVRFQLVHRLAKAVVRLHLIAVVSHEIGGFFYVADALKAILTSLIAHPGCKFPPLGSNAVPNLADYGHPLHP